MSDLIYREDAKDFVRHAWAKGLDVIEYLDEVPAADVQPVVRGKWEEWWPGDCALIMTGEEMLWMCSKCNAKFLEQSNFCPNCGADMREES